MARKCVKYGKSKGKRVCRKFSGTSKTRKAKATKGRCLKWSKGRTRCMRRAK